MLKFISESALKFQSPGDYRIAFHTFIQFLNSFLISFIHLFLHSFINLFIIYLFIFGWFICPPTWPPLHQATPCPPAYIPTIFITLVLFDFMFDFVLFNVKTPFFSHQVLLVIILNK